MHVFFHCDTARYVKRRKYILWITLLPVFQSAVITALIVFVNLRAFYENGYLTAALSAISGAVAAGLLFSFAVFVFTERAVKRNARYTFFEIGEKTLVFSRYSGSYISRGKRVITRRLFVIPLSALKTVGYSEKSGAVFLEAQVREYGDRSERLNYRFCEGFPEFESWWYNENGYKTLPVLKIPNMFGDYKKLCENIAEAKRRFDDAPKRGAYVHKELDFVKKRKAMDKLKRHL